MSRRCGGALRSVRLALLVCLLFASAVLVQSLQSQTASAPPPASRPSETSGRTAGAAKALERGDAASALAQAEAVEREHPETPGLHYVLGSALYRLGRMSAAEHALRFAVSEDGHNVDAQRLLGLSLYRLGRSKEALPYLEGAAANRAQDSDTSFVLGMCYVDANDLVKARTSFASQYDYPLDSPAAFLLEAQLLLRANLKNQAEDIAKQALARNPQLPLAHYLLGEVSLAREDLPHALEQFHLEVQINPGYARTYDRLGDAYLRQGDLRSAQTALNRAVILDPTQTGSYILLGKLMLKQSDPATALLYLRRAEKMDSNNYMSHALLGQALRALKRPEEASQETRRAVELQNADVPRLETMQ